MQLQLFEAADKQGSSVNWFRGALAALGVEQTPVWPDRFGSSLRAHMAASFHAPIRTLSLFSGGGGLDIAFHDAGFDIVEMVEINPRYVETLRVNRGPQTRITCADIRAYTPDHNEPIDVIIGGPPCQTFSAAGRRAAGVMGIDDPRGTLFQEYIRLLNILQPRGFLFENVYGLTGAQGGYAWKQILSAFKGAGYNVSARVLDAADFGVPQHRERLFIVGVRDGVFHFPYPTHGPDSLDNAPYYTAGQAVAGADTVDAVAGLGGRYGHLLDAIPPGLNYSFYTTEMGHPKPVFSWRSKFSDFLYKADPERPVRTLKAQGGQYTGPFSWENRAFTIAELKRLQTLPDTYHLVGGRQVCIEQIGNSVPPQIGRIVALAVREQVMGMALPFPIRYMPPEHPLQFRQRKRALTDVYAKKAEYALSRHRPTEHLLREPTLQPAALHQRQRHLGPNFSWAEEGGHATHPFAITWAETPQAWRFQVAPADQNTLDHCYACSLEITSAAGVDWPLPVKRVCIDSAMAHPTVVTAMWKTFEEYVQELAGVADLVQLSGYYQYAPRVNAHMSFDHPPQDGLWQILQHVTHRVGVGQVLTALQLAYLWHVPEADVVPHLQSLRGLGYEVRSHATNPQMQQGDYLIPYLFPTLTPRSVQLRKKF